MRAFVVARASEVVESFSILERLGDWASSMSTPELERFRAGIVAGNRLLNERRRVGRDALRP